LFNLSSSRQFTSTGKGGIWCYCASGPSFVDDKTNAELDADRPFNGDGKCVSRENLPGYKIVIEGGKNMLTNKEGGKFTISELEVWEVINVENLVYKK
jgi:hypothetical protein